MQVIGTATIVGDDVDTDVIFPARYLAVLDPKDQARHLFEPLGPAVRDQLAAGGVLVGGWNLGCGSSREHAVTALLGGGTRLVIAKSFARIFFRNAINNGLAVVTASELAAALADGDSVSADLSAGRAEAHGRSFAFEPLTAELLTILSAGGLWAARAPKMTA
jgi:3-isopropylmalate/(R)-2-methylmalate dehydratase small subunit